MSRNTEEFMELTEDDLEREAQSPYVMRTLKRIALTIVDPFRAMRFIAYAPDWGIVLFVMGLLTGLGYLQYYLLFKYKMDVPVNFQSSEVEGVRSFIVNWYFSGAFVATGISIAISLAMMVLMTRALSGTMMLKQTSIGVFYANIGRVLVTAVMVLVIAVNPSVVTPIETAGRGMATVVVDTPSGELTTTMIIYFNYTVPLDAETVPMPDVQSSTIYGPTDLELQVNYSASIGGERLVFTADNGTSVLVNYSSISEKGMDPIRRLDHGIMTGFGWTIPEGSLANRGIEVDAAYVLPFHLTYIIPGADNASLPTWASWVYDTASRQTILVYVLPMNASYWITDSSGRTTQLTTSATVFFNATQVPQGQYFSRVFFSGFIPSLFSGMGYFALVWQTLLFVVVARIINELSWLKSVACSAVYLVITLVLGML